MQLHKYKDVNVLKQVFFPLKTLFVAYFLRINAWQSIYTTRIREQV